MAFKDFLKRWIKQADQPVQIVPLPELKPPVKEMSAPVHVRAPRKKREPVSKEPVSSESAPASKPVSHFLTDEQRVVVCKMLAEFKPPTEIVRTLQAEFGVSITPGAVYHYERHPEWGAMVQKYREEYGRYLINIPIYHKRKRLERLEEQYQEAEIEEAPTPPAKRSKRHELRSILHEAREECRPMEEVNVTNQTNMISVQFNGMDDQALLKRREEIMSRINRLGGNSNGKRSEAAQDDPSGGVRESGGAVRGPSKPAIDPQWEADYQSAERILQLESTSEGAVDAPG